MTAFAGVGGAFGSDDTAHVAAAEGLRRTLLGPQGVPVGDPVDDCDANPRDRPHGGPDPRAAQDQEPVLEAILDAEQHAGLGVDHLAFRHHRHPSDRQVAELGQRENAERDRHQRQPVPEIKGVHRPAQRSRLRIGADHRQHQAETSRAQTAQRRIARERRYHRDAEHRDRQELGRAHEQNDRAQQRQRDPHQEGTEQPADQRRHIGGTERPPGLALARHRIAVERGRG